MKRKTNILKVCLKKIYTIYIRNTAFILNKYNKLIFQNCPSNMSARKVRIFIKTKLINKTFEFVP